MKKNAFTLVELLAVIVILGLIAAIAVPSVIDTINDSKEKSYQTTIESVKAATESYMNMSFDNYKAQFVSPGYVNITISELIEEGFLSNDIKNPITGNVLSGSIRVTKISENRYNYEYIE